MVKIGKFKLFTSESPGFVVVLRKFYRNSYCKIPYTPGPVDSALFCGQAWLHFNGVAAVVVHPGTTGNSERGLSPSPHPQEMSVL